MRRFSQFHVYIERRGGGHIRRVPLVVRSGNNIMKIRNYMAWGGRSVQIIISGVLN